MIPHILTCVTEAHLEWDYCLCHSGASGGSCTLVPVLFAVFSRDVREDIDGRMAKSASESKPGRIDKTMYDGISFHSDLNWLECLYETNKLKFKLGSHQAQSVQLKENL